ncbi:hypothetical protein B484DRAFT_450916 [Ochromonadaceae sp. CCMP2298]|nr:hypothetical protein B484DRAFT_450916 [Ochromonadaceae sp. CCMP2298]
MQADEEDVEEIRRLQGFLIDLDEELSPAHSGHAALPVGTELCPSDDDDGVEREMEGMEGMMPSFSARLRVAADMRREQGQTQAQVSRGCTDEDEAAAAAASNPLSRAHSAVLRRPSLPASTAEEGGDGNGDGEGRNEGGEERGGVEGQGEEEQGKVQGGGKEEQGEKQEQAEQEEDDGEEEGDGGDDISSSSDGYLCYGDIYLHNDDRDVLKLGVDVGETTQMINSRRCTNTYNASYNGAHYGNGTYTGMGTYNNGTYNGNTTASPGSYFAPSSSCTALSAPLGPLDPLHLPLLAMGCEALVDEKESGLVVLDEIESGMGEESRMVVQTRRATAAGVGANTDRKEAGAGSGSKKHRKARKAGKGLGGGVGSMDAGMGAGMGAGAGAGTDVGLKEVTSSTPNTPRTVRTAPTPTVRTPIPPAPSPISTSTSTIAPTMPDFSMLSAVTAAGTPESPLNVSLADLRGAYVGMLPTAITHVYDGGGGGMFLMVPHSDLGVEGDVGTLPFLSTPSKQQLHTHTHTPTAHTQHRFPNPHPPTHAHTPTHTPTQPPTPTHKHGYYVVHLLQCLVRPDVPQLQLLRRVLRTAQSEGCRCSGQGGQGVGLGQDVGQGMGQGSSVGGIGMGQGMGQGVSRLLLKPKHPSGGGDGSRSGSGGNKHRHRSIEGTGALREFDYIDVQVVLSRELGQRVLLCLFLRRVPGLFTAQKLGLGLGQGQGQVQEQAKTQGFGFGGLNLGDVGGGVLGALSGLADMAGVGSTGIGSIGRWGDGRLLQRIVSAPVPPCLAQSPLTVSFVSRLQSELTSTSLTLSCLYVQTGPFYNSHVSQIPWGLDPPFVTLLRQKVWGAMGDKLKNEVGLMAAHLQRRHEECRDFCRALVPLFREYGIQPPEVWGGSADSGAISAAGRGGMQGVRVEAEAVASAGAGTVAGAAALLTIYLQRTCEDEYSTRVDMQLRWVAEEERGMHAHQRTLLDALVTAALPTPTPTPTHPTNPQGSTSLTSITLTSITGTINGPLGANSQVSNSLGANSPLMRTFLGIFSGVPASGSGSSAGLFGDRDSTSREGGKEGDKDGSNRDGGRDGGKSRDGKGAGKGGRGICKGVIGMSNEGGARGAGGAGGTGGTGAINTSTTSLGSLGSVGSYATAGTGASNGTGGNLGSCGSFSGTGSTGSVGRGSVGGGGTGTSKSARRRRSKYKAAHARTHAHATAVGGGLGVGGVGASTGIKGATTDNDEFTTVSLTADEGAGEVGTGKGKGQGQVILSEYQGNFPLRVTTAPTVPTAPTAATVTVTVTAPPSLPLSLPPVVLYYCACLVANLLLPGTLYLTPTHICIVAAAGMHKEIYALTALQRVELPAEWLGAQAMRTQAQTSQGSACNPASSKKKSKRGATSMPASPAPPTPSPVRATVGADLAALSASARTMMSGNTLRLLLFSWEKAILVSPLLVNCGVVRGVIMGVKAAYA